MGQQFAVCVCLEEDALFFQVGGHLGCIHQVAFPGHGKVSGMVAEEQGFHIVETTLGSVGILDAAHAQGPRELLEFPVGKYLAQQSLPAIGMRRALLIKGDDAGAFLAAVLQVVKPVIDKGRCVLDAVNCQYTHYLSPFSLSNTI